MASGGNAQIVTIAGARLEPHQTAVDVGQLDAVGASQLATYVGTNVALVKLTFGPQCCLVALAADVVKMDLRRKQVSIHGARVIASFLPRWCVFHVTPPFSLRALKCCKLQATHRVLPTG